MKWVNTNEALSQTIDSMVKYYRLALSKGNEVLKISQELEMIKEYLAIQKFAFDSDFEHTIDVDANICDCLIMRHLLQPFVENAVLHGINSIKSQGFIRITGRLEYSKVVLEISDNGIGIKQEKLEQLLSSRNNMPNNGYGIRNVQKRIEMYFGPDYGIDIKSSINKGTTVKISIPPIYDDKLFKLVDEKSSGII